MSASEGSGAGSSASIQSAQYCEKKRLLVTMSVVFTSAAFTMLCAGVLTDYWLHSRERLADGPNQTLVFRKAHSGLWRKCSTDDNGQNVECETIRYFEDTESDTPDITQQIVMSIRRATAFPLICIVLLLAAGVICFIAHCNYRHKFLTFIAGILFIFSGLFNLVGIVLYIGSVTQEVGNRKPKEIEENPRFVYSYGISFVLTVSSFVLSEFTGVICIYLYISRHKSALRKAQSRSLMAAAAAESEYAERRLIPFTQQQQQQQRQSMQSAPVVNHKAEVTNQESTEASGGNIMTRCQSVPSTMVKLQQQQPQGQHRQQQLPTSSSTGYSPPGYEQTSTAENVRQQTYFQFPTQEGTWTTTPRRSVQTVPSNSNSGVTNRESFGASAMPTAGGESSSFLPSQSSQPRQLQASTFSQNYRPQMQQVTNDQPRSRALSSSTVAPQQQRASVGGGGGATGGLVGFSTPQQFWRVPTVADAATTTDDDDNDNARGTKRKQKRQQQQQVQTRVPEPGTIQKAPQTPSRQGSQDPWKKQPESADDSVPPLPQRGRPSLPSSSTANAAGGVGAVAQHGSKKPLSSTSRSTPAAVVAAAAASVAIKREQRQRSSQSSMAMAMATPMIQMTSTDHNDIRHGGRQPSSSSSSQATSRQHTQRSRKSTAV